MKHLGELFDLPWGQVQRGNGYYSFKTKLPTNEDMLVKLRKLYRKYPLELMVYKAKSGNTVFGGVFNQRGNFQHDLKELLGVGF